MERERVRGTESERGTVRDRRCIDTLSRSVFQTPDTPSFVTQGPRRALTKCVDPFSSKCRSGRDAALFFVRWDHSHGCRTA